MSRDSSPCEEVLPWQTDKEEEGYRDSCSTILYFKSRKSRNELVTITWVPKRRYFMCSVPGVKRIMPSPVIQNSRSSPRLLNNDPAYITSMMIFGKCQTTLHHSHQDLFSYCQFFLFLYLSFHYLSTTWMWSTILFVKKPLSSNKHQWLAYFPKVFSNFKHWVGYLLHLYSYFIYNSHLNYYLIHHLAELGRWLDVSSVTLTH